MNSQKDVFTLQILTRVVDDLAAESVRLGLFYPRDLDLFTLAVSAGRRERGEAEAELDRAEYDALLHQVVPGLLIRLQGQPEAGELRLLLAVALNRLGFSQTAVDLLSGGMVRNPECTIIPGFLDEVMGVEASNEVVARAAVLGGALDRETQVH